MWNAENFSLVATGKPESQTESYGMRAMSLYGTPLLLRSVRIESITALKLSLPRLPSAPPVIHRLDSSPKRMPPSAGPSMMKVW
ncbi:hypothetical protein D3C86_1394320 [compost metagenome]